MIVRFNIVQDTANLAVNVKLINARTGSTTFEKAYNLSDKKRYPFLAHRVVIDVNDQTGSPSIAWMEQSVIFAKYTDAKKVKSLYQTTRLIIKKLWYRAA